MSEGLPNLPRFERNPVDIHTWFSLSYANYLVAPRSVLQSMPEDWQHKFTALLDEMHDAFGHLDWPAYDVRALKRDTEVVNPECPECEGDGEITEDDFMAPCPSCKGSGVTDDHRYETPEEVGFRTDPIPHYNRGRTKLEPKAR